jgi:hypothetical protein
MTNANQAFPGSALGVAFVLAIATTAVAGIITGRKYDTHWTTHNVSFPMPFPLSLTTLSAESGLLDVVLESDSARLFVDAMFSQLQRRPPGRGWKQRNPPAE